MSMTDLQNFTLSVYFLAAVLCVLGVLGGFDRRREKRNMSQAFDLLKSNLATLASNVATLNTTGQDVLAKLATIPAGVSEDELMTAARGVAAVNDGVVQINSALTKALTPSAAASDPPTPES